MFADNMKRRDLVKKLAVVGVTPLLLPGCSWFFGKKSQKTGPGQSQKVLPPSDVIVIGKKQSTGGFAIFNLSEDSLKPIGEFPSGFTPHSVAWSKKGKGLVGSVNSQQLILIDRSGKILSTQSLSDEITYGPVCYWESADQFVVPQVAKGEDEKVVMDDGDEVKAKVKTSGDDKALPQMVYRSAEDAKEVDRFVLERCENVKAMALAGDNVVVLQTAKDTAKKPAQIMKFALDGKHFIYSMLINPPFQPAAIAIADRKCYIALSSWDKAGKPVATPHLFFDMKANKQMFLTSKSNRVLKGMIGTTQATFSKDNELAAFCHSGGNQVTFWLHEDHSFYGMIKLEHAPQYLTATNNPKEFLLSLKDAPPEIIKVGFDKIERIPYGKNNLIETKYLEIS